MDINEEFITSINIIYEEKSELIHIFKGIESNIELVMWLKSTLRGNFRSIFLFSSFFSLSLILSKALLEMFDSV